jgi:hypothetical protein
LLSIYDGAGAPIQILVFVALGAVEALYIASIAAVTFALYRRRSRGLSYSLVFNVTYGVVGGMTPLVAVWLNTQWNNPLAFAWCLTGLCVLSAFASTRLKPSRKTMD